MSCENCACKEANPSMLIDGERDYQEIGNAWRYCEDRDRVLFWSDLFEQYPKSNISVRQSSVLDSKIIVKASLDCEDDYGDSSIRACCSIVVWFDADFDNIKAVKNDDGMLLISIPKLYKDPLEIPVG